jgi:hypothetical protein
VSFRCQFLFIQGYFSLNECAHCSGTGRFLQVLCHHFDTGFLQVDLLGDPKAQKPIPQRPRPLSADIIVQRLSPTWGQVRSALMRNVPGCMSGAPNPEKRFSAMDTLVAMACLGRYCLGEAGPLTLAKARDTVIRKRMGREQGRDPQLEKRKARAEAWRERTAQKQAGDAVEDLVEQYRRSARQTKAGCRKCALVAQGLLASIRNHACGTTHSTLIFGLYSA